MKVYSGPRIFVPKKWNLLGLHGISDATLEMHFGLYEGYVKNTNLLNERLADIRERGKATGSDPIYADLVRGLGFEYNGMRLHELYFDNMTSHSETLGSGRLGTALGEAYGGFDEWRNDFIAVGGMRGVGWAIAYYDTATSESRERPHRRFCSDRGSRRLGTCIHQGLQAC